MENACNVIRGEKESQYCFVHGWAGRGTQFRRFVKPFNAAGYKVVAFDGPAHGKSEGKSTSLLEFEQALIAIYKSIGEPVAIIAHSFGGAATLFAASHGLSVPKLINIASPTIGDDIINTYLLAINGSQSTAKFFKSYVLKTQGNLLMNLLPPISLDICRIQSTFY
jgi:pimeloyl-ACP methyl ester carboxylesterase